MPTPLEQQIADAFIELLEDAEDVPEDLAKELATAVQGEDAPTADALFDLVKTTVGDQPV